ncbi:hypothetical protein [Planococcus salinarum]|nr:hypothetical protein [Planococcus salinarum]TAA73144.1 hypothetical protein D2909_02180 [Planococcus salinarum]
MLTMWTERADEIDQYIDNGGDLVINTREILLFMGQAQVMPVYKLPIKFLNFNVDNGRFAAEKKLKEQQLGFELDNRNPEHEKHFIELLIPDNPKTQRLITDIERNGQLKPGVITHDGFLVDANRRLACMKSLDKKYPNSKYQYLLVHRLPANVPAKEIYKLEVQFQIKQDLKEEYNPINDLLKIREGLEYMSEQELQETLDWTSKKIKDYQNRLDLVDGFLNYIEQPENYTLLINLNEHFVEIQKEINAMKTRGLNAFKIQEAIDVMYRMLEINLDPDFTKSVTQRDHIRYIREAFVNDKIFRRLTNTMFNKENATSQEIFDDVTAAAELSRMQRNNIRPVEQLKKAISSLEQIQDEKEAFNTSDFKNTFMELNELIESIRIQMEE